MNSNIKTTQTSPQIYARIGGVLYLIIIAAGIFGELFVRGKLIVSGDPTATANSIMNSPLLWRTGIAGDLIMHVCDIPLILIFYVLLKPVNKNLALLALLFTMIQTAVLVATKLNLFTPLILLENVGNLKAFEPYQLQSLIYFSIKLDANGFGIGLIFFGLACIVNGYLIFRSTYLPKTLGVLMQIAGLCYLINSFSMILVPAFFNMISPTILAPAFIGELSLCIWLLMKGVNLTKWELKQLIIQ